MKEGKGISAPTRSEQAPTAENTEFSTGVGFVPEIVALAAALTFGLGLFPAPLMALARAAASSLF